MINEENKSHNITLINDSFEYLLKKYAIDKNKYIVPIDYIYNTDNVIENKNLFDVTCVICENILNEPISCSLSKEHYFCKLCIDKYLEQKKIVLFVDIILNIK